MRLHARIAASALLLTVLILPAGAEALELRAHAETIAMVETEADFSGVRGGELLFDASVLGIGLGLGAVYQRLESVDALLLDILFQIHPAVHVGAIRNRWVNPHVFMGGLMGAPLEEQSDSFFGAYYLGAGLDGRLWTGTKFPMATVRWRWLAAGDDPGGVAEHTLLFGLGFRLDDTPE
jgi:hypothetical protein